MRRTGLVLLTVLVALAGTVALIAFFQSRDDPALGTESAPGVAAQERDERVRAGNVVLTHRSEQDGAALRRLAEEIAGPFDPALQEAGQAIIVERRPDQEGEVVGRALGRRIVVAEPGDPALREFAEYWLGRAASE